jgi:hypothetical protein
VAGYSGKPLWPKLGFDPDASVVLIDAPRKWSIAGAPASLRIAAESSAERRRRRTRTAAEASPAPALIAFFATGAALSESLPELAQRIFPAGALWIAWPRRAAGHDSDIREQDIRDVALPLGLVDVKVAALDEDWSGLRLVWRRERRSAPAAARG